MVRYAEWAPLALAERRRRLFVRVPAVATLILSASVGGLISVLPYSIQAKADLYIVGTSVLLLLATLPSRFLQRQSLGRLRDLPSPVEQFAVRVQLSRGRYGYGEDLGLASFVDGWLHFEGHRCAFALPPSPLVPQDGIVIPFAGPAGVHRVEFKTLERSGAFERRVQEWTPQNAATSHTRTVFPPVVPGERFDDGLIFNATWFTAASLASLHFLLVHSSLWMVAPWALAFLISTLALARRIDERRRLRRGLPMLGRRKTRSLP